MFGNESHPERRCQWEGPVGLGLVAVFVLLGLPLLLFATVITTAGLWISYSGLRRGDVHNRLLSLVVLLFFLTVVFLLYLRGRA